MSESPTRIDRELVRYLLDDGADPDAHLDGLAGDIARVDVRFEPQSDVSRSKERFSKLMREGIFLPAPSILIEGRKDNPVLFRNVALEIDDSFDHIFETLKRASILLQNGIKVAVDFSQLRAARSLIRSSHLQSVGPVRFMELFEKAPQGSEERVPLHFRLRVDHLDVEDYLAYAESAPPHVRCSVGITREFLSAVSSDGTIGLSFKEGGEVARRLDARILFEKMARPLFCGRPVDFIFVDALKGFQNLNQLSDRLVLNPQNQLVFAGEFMATGAINLRAFFSAGGFDHGRFAEAVGDAVHFLDNAFERNFYFDDASRELTRQGLRIGVGVMGLGEVLSELNPEANPRKELKLIERIQDSLFLSSFSASRGLGEKRGLKHQVYRKGAWHRTRHSQTVAQIHLPLLSQICNVPQYLFARGMTFADFLKMHERHALWQSLSGNVVSFKHPVKGMDAEKLARLFASADALNLPTLEFA
jgi:ribonucleoside-diphosphate reductase alpha chain